MTYMTGLFDLVSVPTVLPQDSSLKTIGLPINAKLEKCFDNGKWCPGPVISSSYQFDDEMPITARCEVAFDDVDHEFISSDELQHCRISHRPPHVNNSTPVVETVDEDDDDVPCSSPMDDTPLD